MNKIVAESYPALPLCLREDEVPDPTKHNDQQKCNQVGEKIALYHHCANPSIHPC